MKYAGWCLSVFFAVLFVRAATDYAKAEDDSRTAYSRGYTAAVDSVRNVSAPPETLRVVVRRGQSVTVWEPSGNGMQVWP